MDRQGKLSKLLPASILLIIVLLLSSGFSPLATAASVSNPDSPGDIAVADHLITEIVLDPPNPNVLKLNQNLNLTFKYQTTEAGGVRIFARPFSGGALAPNYAAHGSGIYPSGSGNGSGFFTITTGSVLVDQIRFQMYNADQSALLFEGFIPVHYQFRDPANIVSEITLTPPTPNILKLNQDVNLTFKYTTNHVGGVRIFARPFSGGALAPNYAAHGSIVHPTGSGNATGSFTITTGSVVVDQIRIQMVNADQTLLLFEAFIPVYYLFEDLPNMVSEITLSPMTPNILDHNQNVNLTFKYQTTEAGGVRIFARPFTMGAASPSYAAHGSGIYPTGSGNGTGFFTITSQPVVVDHIRFQIYNADQTSLLFEAFIPVYYQYGPVYRTYLPIVIKE